MRILRKDILDECIKRHAEARGQFEAWYEYAKRSTWKKPLDIISNYATARMITNDRAVFNIKGNKYRLIARIDFKRGFVQIRFADTHSEYDKIDATRI